MLKAAMMMRWYYQGAHTSMYGLWRERERESKKKKIYIYKSDQVIGRILLLNRFTIVIKDR